MFGLDKWGPGPLLDLKPPRLSWLNNCDWNCKLLRNEWDDLNLINHKVTWSLKWLWVAIKWKLFNQRSRLIGTKVENMRNKVFFNRGIFDRELCDSGDFSCPRWLSAGAISDLLKHGGKEKGLSEKWGVKHGLGRIYLTPKWFCVSVCVYMFIHVCRQFCDNAAAAIAQFGVRETLQVTFRTQIKLKFPLLFFRFSPPGKLAEETSWFVSLYSLPMHSWHPIYWNLHWACTAAHWNRTQLLVCWWPDI